MSKVKKILALTLMLSTFTCLGLLTACGGNGDKGHTHSYTQWAHDDAQHWKVCPDDNAIDESTRENHVFVAGECECGASQTLAPVKYGTASGQIKLHKQGEYVTDYAGVVIDFGDDDVDIDYDSATGAFTAENVLADTPYTFTVSKTGYQTYTTTVEVEEDDNAVIGGENGIVLEYDMFGYLEGYDMDLHDFSKVNEAVPYIRFKEHEGVKTLNVLTRDSYTEVSASLRVKWDNSNYDMHTQGIVLKFEDGSHAVVRYHNGNQTNGNIQYCNNAWSLESDKSVFSEDKLDQWGENNIHPLVSTETTAIKDGDGLDLTVVVKDGGLHTYFADNWVASYTLPDSVKDKKVQVGYFAWDTASNAVFYYGISEETPSLTAATDIKVEKPDGIAASVTADKESYAMGETVTLTVAAPEGYKLDSISVNGTDMLSEVANGKLTLIANRNTIEVNAVFVKEEPITINISVKGKKLGTTAALPDETAVTLGQTKFFVNNGVITGEVAKGRCTVSVNGYKSQELVIDENLTEIVFEYDAFEIVRWDHDSHGLAHVNDTEPYIEWEGPGTSLNAVTKECLFTNASVSVTIKGGFSTDGAKQQGVILRFEDGKAAILNINIDGVARLQFRPDLFPDENDASIGLKTVLDQPWVEFKNVTTAEVQKYNSETGIELKILRYGKSLFVYLDGEFKGRADLPDNYENSKMGFGVFSFGAVVGAQWKYAISENVSAPTVEITNATPSNANGTISVSQNTIVGDTVTITVTPSEGYILKTLTVSEGVTPVLQDDGTYTFVAEKLSYTVTAEFVVASNPVEAEVKGTTLGNVTSSLADGTTVKFTNKDTEMTTALTVTGGKVNGVLLDGEYVVSVDGYYELEATVTDGAFAESTDFVFQKIVFTTNGINEPTNNIFGDEPVSWAADAEKAASEGKIKSVKDGKIYEWSVDEYDDVAITVTLKSGNGNQGLAMRFGGLQKDVRLRFENNKAQWLGGSWWWGTCAINDRWDFGNGNDYANEMSSALLEKYNGAGLSLTLARKGGMVYALIDGKLYAAQSVSEFSTSKVRLCVFVEGAKNGYDIPFVIEDTDTVLARAGVAVGEDLTAYGGVWTEDSEAGTLKVSGGRGYAEFKTEANTVKESATIKIKGDVGDDQGIMYRFADGKYIAVRYQNNGGNYKVQYTMDTVFFSDGSLKSWTDFMMTDEEKNMFDASGLDVTVIRDGAKFYILLGDRLLDITQLDEKYAEMSGVMGIMIWNGKDAAFSYAHSTGTDVTVPEYNTVSGTADIVTDPTAEVAFGNDITEDGTTYEVLAYERFGQDSADNSAKNVSSDSSVLNGAGWITNNGGASSSFGSKGYTVTGVNGIVDGSCVYIQTGDANIKITKDVAQIRIYVGAWNAQYQQGGTFTLKVGDKTIATYTYANNGEGTPNGDKQNDVIVFTIDTSALGEDDVVNAVLHFENGYTESTQPCAGIQVLGVKQATEAE